MSAENNDMPMHYVTTRDEARKVAKGKKHYWVSDCGCRKGNESGCKRSPVDVCLCWAGPYGSTEENVRELNEEELEKLFKLAEEKHLVTRPFRKWDPETKSVIDETDGVCFCCDCCCAYFTEPGEACDKGPSIEKTDRDSCTDCGACVDVCYFKARKIENGKLEIISDNCYGCGLCADVCSCITMAKR